MPHYDWPETGDNNQLTFPRTRPNYLGRVNLREVIKNHGRRLEWGNGYTLVGEDRKLIEDIFERARGDLKASKPKLGEVHQTTWWMLLTMP